MPTVKRAIFDAWLDRQPEPTSLGVPTIGLLSGADAVDHDSGGLDDARWFKLGDILDLNFYNDILPLITKAVNILVAK